MTTSTAVSVDSERAGDVLLAPGDVRLLALRSRLEIQREFRLEQLAALERVGAPGPLGSSDREVFASLAAGARVALRQVQAALRRMELGTYGRCTSCGALMDVERLAAVPSADRCTACQLGPDRSAGPRPACRTAGARPSTRPATRSGCRSEVTTAG